MCKFQHGLKFSQSTTAGTVFLLTYSYLIFLKLKLHAKYNAHKYKISRQSTKYHDHYKQIGSSFFAGSSG